MGKGLIAACVVFLVASSAFSQLKDVKGKAHVSSVTLYRSQALVTRLVEVDAKSVGELAILVDNLPDSVDANSLFATSDDMDIRSVRFFSEFVPEDKKKGKLADLQRKLEANSVALAKLDAERQNLNAKKRFLDKLEAQYVSRLGPTITPSTQKEAAVSGFKFDTIEKMTKFVFDNRSKLMAKSVALDDAKRKLEKEKRSLDEALRSFSIPNARPCRPGERSQRLGKYLRKAMVYAAKKKQGKAFLKLNYLLHGVGWSPAYNMRIESDGDTLSIEYLAHIRQQSGEDWNGVSLTLSTATPNMNAGIPVLVPLWTHLMPAEAVEKIQETSNDSHSIPNILSVTSGNSALILTKGRNKINAKFQQLKAADTAQYNKDLNISGWNYQALEYKNNIKVLRRWYENIEKTAREIAVEYKIPDAITLPSRKETQMAKILSESIACSLHYEVVPLLADYAARALEAKNTLKQPLLAGEYSAFIDGQYVGSGTLSQTVTGQTLRLGFGIDPQIQCSRELIDKKVSKSWGSRIETYEYQIAIFNFKSKSVAVRVLDRIPATKDKELTITMKKGKEELSKDEEYRKLDLPGGILRWDMTLPESSFGINATKFNYSFTMKFDSDAKISVEGALEDAIERELMKMNERK